jgi:hypothetical protein
MRSDPTLRVERGHLQLGRLDLALEQEQERAVRGDAVMEMIGSRRCVVK